MTLRILDEAREEMRQSAHWYEDKRSGLGDDFLDAMQNAFELVEQHPKRFKRLQTKDPDREVRRLLLSDSGF